jgi:pyruvate carboxylase subunit B
VKKEPAREASAPAVSTGPIRYKITVGDESYEVLVEEGSGDITSVQNAAATATKAVPEEIPALEIFAQLPGNVYEVMVQTGDTVKKGDTLVILEAMKMETPVTAPEDGVIASIEVEKGQTVQSGQLIATLE